MNAPRVIPDTVRDKQIEASDPAVSAWVAANAGSGKTHVLAQRVIRLLLQDFDPAKILCITFTKAAAANMANRVFDELRKWTALDDTALDTAIRSISNAKPDAALRARARRLFALALETPGGLKVQTIHAFCTHLLHMFPFEANVAARFNVMDEATEAKLLDEITRRVLLAAAASPDGPLGRALAAAIAAAADMTFRDMVREAIRQRDKLAGWIEDAGGVEGAIAQLSQSLGIDPADSNEKVDSEFFKAALIQPSEWPAIAAAMAEGSKTDADQSDRFVALAATRGAEQIETYLDIFCTKDRSKTKDRLATKKIATDHPELVQRLIGEQARVWSLMLRKRAIAARDRTAALVTIADAVIVRYRSEKDRRGLLDYEDLIDKARALLESGASAWVHYKLDRGIDHVLIDEAQDTSPKQWAIVRALTAEFFAGAGARSAPRTIFAVGDEKQSIFSFQGAAPHEFEAMHREFHALSKAVDRELNYVRFAHSFRSGENVLTAVDTVFKPREVFAGVTTDQDGFPPHLALANAAPGLVEIWDTEKPADKREIEGWDAPFDEVSETSTHVRLARRIAKHAQVWCQQGRRPGDVLVLVRRRGPLFEAVIRALKTEGIPVAGADRLVLTEHIAVMDLMTLADALLLPDDDLALATVLKSPLFGLDDDALFQIAWDRKGSLLASLRDKRPELAARFDEIAHSAREYSPFTFYAGLLGEHGGRKAFLARLGHEAADALDEFLNLALDYERSQTPSLQGFIAWMRAAETHVKRDMETARDEVRVMTVHGAKGLEARIVILADTTTPPQGWHPPRLLSLPAQNAAPGTPGRLVWAGSKTADAGSMGDARESALDLARNEYRRLLYVAMTRAIERLIVCGIDGEKKRPEGCWYDLVHDALQPDAVVEPADDGDGTVLRYRKAPEASQSQKSDSKAAPELQSSPEWLTHPAKTDDKRARPITPSGFVDDPATTGHTGRGEARRRAIRRGNLVHRLMQSLPDVPPDNRKEKTRDFLARQDEIDDAERSEIAVQALRLLADPRFAALFTPGSRAEVSIVGHVKGERVSGQVDRLVVTPDEVLIADYKTNRAPPKNPDEALKKYGSYARQLALYRAVLMKLYPNKTVRAALLWTDTPDLMEIPAKDLDSALDAALTSP